MNRKKNMKKLLFPFFLIILLSLIMAACSSNDSSSTNTGNGDKQKQSNDGQGSNDQELADKQVLNLTKSGDISTMDSSKATDATSMHTLMRVNSGLLAYNGDDEIVPELAKKLPEVNKDKTKYTFELRDAKWSDGSPITADQFVYAWHRALDPDTQSQYASIFASAHIKNAAKIIDPNSDMYGKTDKLGVKAKDEQTLVVTLSQSTPEQYFNSLMQFPTLFPLKKEFVEKQGEDYAQEPDNILYSGPFKMKQWDHGAGWTLVKNDQYWNADKITLQQVNYKIVKEPKTKLKLYKGGKIDFVKLQAQDVDKYKDDKEFATARDSAVYYWNLNRNKVEAFKNKKLRRAMWLSMDRKSAADVILNDGSVPANYLVPQNFATGPNGKYFHETGKAQLDNYPGTNKEKAKKLWKQAKNELGIDTLNVKLLTSDTEKAQDLSEYYVNQITENLEGFNIKINKVPSKSYLERSAKGNCEICGGDGWGPDYEDPTTFLNLFTTDNPQYKYGISNQKYDELLNKANRFVDQPEKRWEALQKADRYLAKNAVFLPLYQKGKSILYKSYVKNYDLPKKSVGVRNYYRYAKILKH